MRWIGASAPIQVFDLDGARERIRAAVRSPRSKETGDLVADWTRQAYEYIARNPRSHGRDRPSMAKEQSTAGLLSVIGSVTKSNREAGRLTGVDEKNIRRYRGGANPTEGNRRKLVAAVRRIRLKPGREKLLRRQTPPVFATATLQVSKEKRQRRINLTDYIDQGDWHAVIDAYIGVGDLSGAVENMVTNAIEEYLSEADVVSLDNVEIGAKR